MENPIDNGSIPFLDTLVSQSPNNTLITSNYRKPTHTNQYLHWGSNHYSAARYSAFNTLAHRARMVCTWQPGFKEVENHIRQTSLTCNYPLWVINKLQTKINHKFSIIQAHIPGINPTAMTAKQATTIFS